MREGVDYVNGPAPAVLKAAGKTFVCRYVSKPGDPKNLTEAEAKRLILAGLDIVIVFETVPNRALQGFLAGRTDAKSADHQVSLIGGPKDSPIYFAVDFDATVQQQASINRYLAGAASILGTSRTGVYGGYWVVKRALAQGTIRYAWQTYAWSGGKWHDGAQIQQYQNGVKLGGHEVDLDRAMYPDFGQWSYKPTIHDAPLPGPLKKPPWFWLALKEYLRRRGNK